MDEECSEASGVARAAGAGVTTVGGLGGALAALAGGSGPGVTSDQRRDFKSRNGFGERNALLVGSGEYRFMLLSCLSSSGWAGGVVTSSTHCEEDARSSSSWKDEGASTEGCGDSGANAESRY